MSSGLFFVLSSTLLYAALMPLLKKANQTIAPFTTMSISMFVLFLGSLMLALILEKPDFTTAFKQKEAFIILVFVGILNVCAFYLEIRGYPYMSIWQQSLFGLLAPVLSAFIAYFLLGESIDLFKFFVGLGCMTLGLYIILR